MSTKTNPKPTTSPAGRQRSGWDELTAVVRTGARVCGVLWRFSCRHPVACSVVPLLVVLVWAVGPLPVAAGGAVAAVWAACWWRENPAALRRHVVDRARTAWRWEWVYHRRWTEICSLCGLVRIVKDRPAVPKLERVRSSWATDVLTIHEAPGQEPIDWELKAPTLAESFEALGGRVRRLSPGRIQLELVTHRQTALVEPLPVTPADRLDLGAVPVALEGNGETWSLPIAGLNVEIVGRQGAGKTEGAAWSLIRGLAGKIATGEVVIWAGDPTRGSGLAHGRTRDAAGHWTCPLFGRMARSPVEVAEMIFDASDLMCEREEQLYQSGQRRYQASTEMPTVILVIDELLSLTTLLRDRQLAGEIGAAIPELLSRARKVGIVFVVLSQDGRDRAMPAGDLIQIPICMGVKRAALVDVVLGQGAHALGAHAERIPVGDAGAGQAWVLPDDPDDGDAPLWVRFSYVSRDVADAIGEQYPTPWAWHPSRGLYRPAEDPPGPLAVMEHLASALHQPAGPARAPVVDIARARRRAPALHQGPSAWAVNSAGQAQQAQIQRAHP